MSDEQSAQLAKPNGTSLTEEQTSGIGVRHVIMGVVMLLIGLWSVWATSTGRIDIGKATLQLLIGGVFLSIGGIGYLIFGLAEMKTGTPMMDLKAKPEVSKTPDQGPREWTSTKDGHRFEAVYLREDKDGVIVRRSLDTKLIRLAKDKLAEADRSYVATLTAAVSKSDPSSTRMRAAPHSFVKSLVITVILIALAILWFVTLPR